VSTPTTTASPWPSKAAYFSAAVFIGASGTTNVLYGWQKGTNLPTSLVWAGVAGAVAVIFAISWPALIRSLEARRWSAALISLLALVLAGTYSVTAALGSAAGGRTNAATQETAVTDVRAKAQAAYDTAKAELATLKPARPVAELEAIIGRNPEAGGRCAFVNGSLRTVCPPHPLAPELARAKRRAELEAKVESEASKLATTGPAKIANSDAKALAQYVAAIGFEVTADRLNDLLVLLAVMMIEAGGGLSLALGLALSAAPAGRPEASPSTPADHPSQSVQPPAHARPATPATAPVHPTARPATILDYVAGQGGRALTSRRRLANSLGRPATTVADELARLVASGAVRATPSARGTLVELARGARPN
jgi:hypothetical protein